MRKKYLLAVMVLSLNVCLISGCGNKQEQSTADENQVTVTENNTDAVEDNSTESSEADTQTSEAQSEDDSQTEGDASTHYLNVVYKDVIDKYKVAINENWDYGKCMEEDICPLITNADAASLEDIGVALVDMDHDGYYELIIGNPKDSTGKSVYEIWTYDGSKTTKLITAQERCLVNVGYWQEDDVYFICTMGSNSAVEFEYDYYTIMNGALNNVQSILSEATSETETKWYQLDTESGERTEIEEKLANDIIDSNEASWILPEYFTLDLM